MLKLEHIKRPPGHRPEALRTEAARLLRIPPEDLLSLEILRRSVDAREGASLVYAAAVSVGAAGASSPGSPRRLTASPALCLRRRSPLWWRERGPLGSLPP